MKDSTTIGKKQHETQSITLPVLAVVSKQRKRLSCVGMEKLCKLCGQVKDSSQFSVTGKYFDGTLRTHIYCKPCYSAYRMSKYDPIKRKEKSKKNPEPNDRTAARMARYRAERPDHFKEYQKKWRSENSASVKMSDHKKRIRRVESISATEIKITKTQWQQIVEDHGGKCFYCGLGFLKMSIDHVVPLSKGGEHSVENVVPACRSCNSRKSAQDVFVFAEKAGKLLMGRESTSQSEAKILGKIMVSITHIDGAMFWRNNTGSVPTPHGTMISFGLIGSPDIIGVYRGKAVGIEVKTQTGRLNENQKNFRKRWELSGGVYIIARSPEDALAGLRRIFE
jgi:5-methylcytosine-specific restriction endonuclease McrA